MRLEILDHGHPLRTKALLGVIRLVSRQPREPGQSGFDGSVHNICTTVQDHGTDAQRGGQDREQRSDVSHQTATGFVTRKLPGAAPERMRLSS